MNTVINHFFDICDNYHGRRNKCDHGNVKMMKKFFILCGFNILSYKQPFTVLQSTPLSPNIHYFLVHIRLSLPTLCITGGEEYFTYSIVVILLLDISIASRVNQKPN